MKPFFFALVILAGAPARAEEIGLDAFEEMPTEFFDGKSFNPNLLNAPASPLSAANTLEACGVSDANARSVPACPMIAADYRAKKNGRFTWQPLYERCGNFIDQDCNFGATGKKMYGYFTDGVYPYGAGPKGSELYFPGHATYEGKNGAKGRIDHFFANPPFDIDKLCKNYRTFDRPTRARFWIYAMMQISRDESFCDHPSTRIPPRKRRPKRDNGIRVGAFQLEYDYLRAENRPYECSDEFIRANFRNATIADTLPNVFCAMSMLAVQLAKPGMPEAQDRSENGNSVSVGRVISNRSYWQQLRTDRRPGAIGDPIGKPGVMKSMMLFGACGNDLPADARSKAILASEKKERANDEAIPADRL